MKGLRSTIVQVTKVQEGTSFRVGGGNLLVFYTSGKIMSRKIARAKRRIATVITSGFAGYTADMYVVTRATKISLFPVSVKVIASIPSIASPGSGIVCKAGGVTVRPTVSERRTTRTILVNVQGIGRLTRRKCSLVTANRVKVKGAAADDTIISILLSRDMRGIAKENTNLDSRKLGEGVHTVGETVRGRRPSGRSILSILSGIKKLSVTKVANTFLNNTVCRVPILVSKFVSSTTTLYTIQVMPRATSCVLTSRYSKRPTKQVILRRLGLPCLVSTGVSLKRNDNTITTVPLLRVNIGICQGVDAFRRVGMRRCRRLG